MTAFWRAVPDGVAVAVKVQPRARRPGVLGTAASADGLRLRIAVTEPPDEGRANRAVCATLAAALHVAPSAVTIAAGTAAREKRLHVSGDPAVLGPLLAAL